MIRMKSDTMRRRYVISLDGEHLFVLDGSCVMGSRAITKLLDLSVRSTTVPGSWEVACTSETVSYFSEVRAMLDHPEIDPIVIQEIYDSGRRMKNARSLAEGSVLA